MPTDVDLTEAILLLVALGYTQEAAELAATALYAQAVQDQLVPEEGNNLIFDLTGLDVANGGNGDDRIFGLGGDDTLIGGNGNDTIAGEGGLLAPQGFNSDDLIFGNDGDDLLTGGTLIHVAGTILSTNPDSILLALVASGNDSLFGGNGNDTVAGGDGADSLSGDAGNDSMTGGTGTDTLMDLQGNNTFSGGGGNDSLFGGLGQDSMAGGDGDDILSNLGGLFLPETLDGGSGNDTVQGGFGVERLLGGSGADSLSGGFGNDTLTGGLGVDVMSGGSGGDTFVFGWSPPGLFTPAQFDAGSTEATADRITDWSSQDSIDLNGSNLAGYVELAGNFATFDAAKAAANAAMAGDANDIVAVQQGANVVVFVDFNNASNNLADSAIILEGRTLADVSAADFV